MGIAYIEAQERIQIGMSDTSILYYDMSGGTLKRCRERVLERFARRAPLKDRSGEVSSRWRQDRIAELKSIMQRSHPDKASADILTFKTAKEELARLRINRAE
ncbi:MAG: hypothetical protein KJ558_13895 [Gammaproteobacteria bacterium]|nr:hypothetical protein [Gammaproteobacteria bacterium]MBU1655885.1 hypothetical protein [Gammaproteobacteria bacterium]MBU1961018.1 hypothetical protein [Gammaproteobacteria bacterium]